MNSKQRKTFCCKLASIAATCFAIMLVFSSPKSASADHLGDGWCYNEKDSVLHITSDQGIERFFSKPNAPTEFGQILFEDGVTTIELLGRGIPSQPSMKVQAELISISKTVTDIAVGNIYDRLNSASFQRILIDADNPTFYKENGMLIEKSSQTVLFADYDMEKAIVPHTVRTIGYGAFSNHVRLKAVILSEGLQSIGLFAFNECVSLSQINLPNSLTAVFDGAFSGCEQLNSLVFPPRVQFYLTLVSSSEGTAGASLLDCNYQLQTIVFANAATYHGDAIRLHKWPESGNGKLVLIGPPSGERIADYRFLGSSQYAVCYFEEYADDWKTLTGVYDEGTIEIRQLTGKEEKEIRALCKNINLEQLQAPDAGSGLGWSFQYEFDPNGSFYDDQPSDNLKTAYHVFSDEGLRNLQDGNSLGYVPLSMIDLVLEDGITEFSPVDNAYQPVNRLQSFVISATVEKIRPNSFSSTSVTVSPANPYYHMDSGKLIETATGKVIWQAKTDGTDAPASTAAISRETPTLAPAPTQTPEPEQDGGIGGIMLALGGAVVLVAAAIVVLAVRRRK